MVLLAKILLQSDVFQGSVVSDIWNYFLICKNKVEKGRSIGIVLSN